jgi:uncharacterized membrane protein (DUF441 family)
MLSQTPTKAIDGAGFFVAKLRRSGLELLAVRPDLLHERLQEIIMAVVFADGKDLQEVGMGAGSAGCCFEHKYLAAVP